MEIQLSIPLDEDGFIEMECDYCKSRFLLHESVYSDEENLHFFCPICGIPNKISTFYCPEILDAVEQKVWEYMHDDILRRLGPTIKEINKSGFVKMSLDMPKKEPEKELYAPINEYVISHQSCCDIDVKTIMLDAQIGLYCPICGGSDL